MKLIILYTGQYMYLCSKQRKIPIFNLMSYLDLKYKIEKITHALV